jgi:hypothetical protein
MLIECTWSAYTAALAALQPSILGTCTPYSGKAGQPGSLLHKRSRSWGSWHGSTDVSAANNSLSSSKLAAWSVYLTRQPVAISIYICQLDSSAAKLRPSTRTVLRDIQSQPTHSGAELLQALRHSLIIACCPYAASLHSTAAACSTVSTVLVQLTRHRQSAGTHCMMLCSANCMHDGVHDDDVSAATAA